MSAIDPIIGPSGAELFRAELAEVRTDAEFQALRNSWLGRKNGWIAAFMALLKTATPEHEERARPRRQRAEEGCRSRASPSARRSSPRPRRPANAVDITLPGRVAAARPSSSAQPDPRRGDRDLHAPRLPGARRPRDRRRLPQLRSAQHARGSSRARHAGHAVPRQAADCKSAAALDPLDAAAHAHQRDADPAHGEATRRRCAWSRSVRSIAATIST